MGFSVSRQGYVRKLNTNFAGEAEPPSRFRWEGKRKLTESSRECPMASTRWNLKGSLRRHGLVSPENPLLLLYPRVAEALPVYFAVGIRPALLHCAAHTLSVPSIQRATFCISFSDLLGFPRWPHRPIPPPRIIPQLKAPVMRSPCAQCASLSFTSPVSSSPPPGLACPLQVP